MLQKVFSCELLLWKRQQHMYRTFKISLRNSTTQTVHSITQVELNQITQSTVGVEWSGKQFHVAKSDYCSTPVPRGTPLSGVSGMAVWCISFLRVLYMCTCEQIILIIPYRSSCSVLHLYMYVDHGLWHTQIIIFYGCMTHLRLECFTIYHLGTF